MDKKRLMFVRTNGYDALVSYDEATGTVRYLTETTDFPRTDAEIPAFMESVEDCSSWEFAENVSDLESWLNLDGHLGDASEILMEM